MNAQKNTLTLLSGKGGSGKTVIALSISKVLAEAGFKVLLVDCDLSTHGATYFFESELESNQGQILSTVELLTQGESSKVPLNTKAGFAFIPSTSSPSDIITLTASASEQEIRLFLREMELLCENYDAVIFDCQAGYSSIAAATAEFSQRNLIVLEPDAVSSAALRILYLQLGKKLRSNTTWQIFNKLTEEERPIYEKIFGGTLFNNLPPIPFDWQVRAAFATCDIPGVTSKWSAFGLGVMRVIQTLFPSLKDNLASLENEVVGSWHGYLTDKIDMLQEQKRRIEYEQIEKLRTLRLGRNKQATRAFATFGALISFFAATSAWIEDVTFIKIGVPAVIAIVGVFVSAGAIYYNSLLKKEVEAERKQDLSQQSIAEIESELKKYITLIATDPRLKDYERAQIRALHQTPTESRHER